LKVLIVLQLMQLAGSKFQSSITLFENAYFLTFSLNVFLNSSGHVPFYHPHLAEKKQLGINIIFSVNNLEGFC